MLYLYWEITSDINPNSKRHCLGRERFKHRSPTWNECINHPLERLSFECPKVTVAFVLLQRYTIGWKCSSLFHPIRVKIKPNRNSLRHVFPLYGSAKCVYAFISGHPGGLTPGIYGGIARDLLTFGANFWLGTGAMDRFCTSEARYTGKDPQDL